jgi:hypothetical protein
MFHARTFLNESCGIPLEVRRAAARFACASGCFPQQQLRRVTHFALSHALPPRLDAI